MSDAMRTISVRVEGRVQNVGYRAFTQDQASQLGVGGWVANRADGAVEAALHGPGAALATMVERMRQGPPAAEVSSLDVRSADRGLTTEAPAGAHRF